MARKKREAAAAAMTPMKMKGDGVEEEDIRFVDSFKYLGFHFESGGARWQHVGDITCRRQRHLGEATCGHVR